MSIESVTVDCILNVLVCEYLISSQLFDVQMSFMCTLIYCIGCIIVDLDIVCHSLYIFKIGTDKLVKKFKNRFDHKSQFDRGGHHHPGLSSWFWQLMTVIYSHYFSETYYQYLRVVDYHIDCKEWRIERQLDSSWEGIYQYLVTIDALTIEICLNTCLSSYLCRIQPLATMLKLGIFYPFEGNYSSSSPLPYVQGVAAIFFCWHWSVINFCEEMCWFYPSTQCFSDCVALAIYIVSPVWLYRGHSFHFHSKKLEEKLGNTDDTQMCIGVSLKGGRLSVAVGSDHKNDHQADTLS